MKKYIFIIIGIYLTSIFSACNDNLDSKMDGIDEAVKPKDIKEYNKYIVKDADFTSIARMLRDRKTPEDDLIAAEITASRKFSVTADAAKLVPHLLNAHVKAPDVGSSIKVEYNYEHGRDAEMASLSSEQYILNSADYATVWGNPSVDVLTPAKAPNNHIPNILKTRFNEVPAGTFKNVSYFYSSKEPIPSNVMGRIHMEEDFTSYEVRNLPIDKNGWITKDLSGTKAWTSNVFSGNLYAQVGSNASNEKNVIWMITPKVSLASTVATNPRLAFDINVGYYNADCLTIKISKNYDGNEANITTATWTDITNSFTIPRSLTWGTLGPAGSADLKSYVGENVYIAFVYDGDDTSTPKRTTRYQVDNVKIYEETPGLDVESKEVLYALYSTDGTIWREATDPNLVILQPKDYQEMGLSFITIAQAPNYIPIYLKKKFEYAQEGHIKKVIHRTNATTACRADTYTYTDKEWKANSTVETKIDQFVFARTTVKEWIFDPTLLSVMTRDDYMEIVTHVKEHQAIQNPALVAAANNAEFYYGFSARYSNITYRDQDRVVDTTYPAQGTRPEKLSFLNKRTEEGLAILLSIKYPNATPIVNGVTQEARITTLIHDREVTNWNTNWTYRFKCIGDKEWQFIERISADGHVDKAGEY